MIYSKLIDFWFIRFPIIFPIIYATILYGLPEFENYLIFLTILLLAEPHFGATWAIFFDKVNYDYFKKKKEIFYLGSIFLILFCVIGFFTFKNLFLLIFFSFNIYHVSRQSIGICKLYSKDKDENLYQELFIYLFNFIFLCTGLFRFYLPIFSNSGLLYLNILIIITIALVACYHIKKFKNLENSLTMITGIIIFYPICFVSNPIHAILLGVTMHYSQYILVTTKVFYGRNNILNYLEEKKFKNFLSTKYFLIIFIYGSLMAIFSVFGKSNFEIFTNLILIPIIGQMLHFYLDGFLWKFSELHNREVTLKHIKEKIKSNINDTHPSHNK